MGLLWLGGSRAVPCHACAHAATVHGKALKESWAFCCFPLLPDMFTATWRVFCPGSDCPPVQAGELFVALSVLLLSPFQPGQQPHDRPRCNMEPRWGHALLPWLVAAGGRGVMRCVRPRYGHTPVAGGQPERGSSCRLLESGPSPNNGWRAGNAAWETGFGSAAAASHGPLAPFLSLLQRALPTAIG